MVSEVKESSDFMNNFRTKWYLDKIRTILRTFWTKFLDNFRPISEQFVQIYAFIVKFGLFLTVIQSFFSQEGRYLGIGIPRERNTSRYTPSERREITTLEKDLGTGKTQSSIVHRHTNPVVKGKRSSARNISGTLLTKGENNNPTAKGKRVPAYNPLRRAARPSQGTSREPHPAGRQDPGTRKSYGGRQGPVSGASRDPTRRAETLTLEGANQDIKESGHRSRRPPAHKGYNQFIKDARRSQRATQLSQLKPMEGKIWSLTQTCRNANREWTLQIERHP